MNVAEAKKAMERHIVENFGEGIDIVDSQTLETQEGWVFFYNTREFITTGDHMCALMSNAPCLVARDGRIFALPMALSVEEALEMLRGKHNLRT